MPTLYLLIILASIVTPSFWWLLGLMLLFSWMTLVGVVRAEFLRARNFDYVRAARALGVSDARDHVPPPAAQRDDRGADLPALRHQRRGGRRSPRSTSSASACRPGSPSLGELLEQGKNNLQAPWLGFTGFVVIALMLTLLVFIGEAVRDAFDPRKMFAGDRAAAAAAPSRRPSARREPTRRSARGRRRGAEALLRGRRSARALRRGADAVDAVRGVSLRRSQRGETLALVGESGSGKSVTALSILQLLPYPLAQPSARQHPLPGHAS